MFSSQFVDSVGILFDHIMLLGAKIKLSRVGELSLANAFTSS